MGRCERFDVPYLVCNTKFSEQAIQYASCIGLKLIGWNYPGDRSISYILTKNKIYPITILRSVNAQTMELLSEARAMFCSDLTEKKLLKIGVSKSRTHNILSEVKECIKTGT